MSIADLRTSLARPWAGLAMGPACWALDTQTNYALVQWACHGKWNPLPVIAGALAAVSLIGALSSWFAWHRHDGPGFPIPEQDGHPHHLLSGLGMAAGVLFALVIVMQGIGALVVDPCLR